MITLTPMEWQVLLAVKVRGEQGLDWLGFFNRRPALIRDREALNAFGRLDDLGLIVDPKKKYVAGHGPTYFITIEGRSAVADHEAQLSEPVSRPLDAPRRITGVDTGFAPGKTVAVVGSFDTSRIVPFEIHEIFEVARWEETETHILGWAPNGTLVAKGNKACLRTVGSFTTSGRPVKAPVNPCPACGAAMGTGTALVQHETPSSPETGTNCFHSMDPAELVDCIKCPACGHSETLPAIKTPLPD